MHVVGVVLHPQRESAEAVDAVLCWAERSGGQGYDLAKLDFHVIHTGGPRVLDAPRSHGGVPAEALGDSRETLSSHGNIASAAVLDVLRRVAEKSPAESATGIIAGFGPGITMELALGTWVHDPADALLGLSEADVAGQAITHKGFERIEHHAPVLHGDTLYAESEVLGKSPVPGRPERGLVDVETRGRNQDGTLIMTFCRKLVVPVASAAHPQVPVPAAPAAPAAPVASAGGAAFSG